MIKRGYAHFVNLRGQADKNISAESAHPARDTGKPPGNLPPPGEIAQSLPGIADTIEPDNQHKQAVYQDHYPVAQTKIFHNDPSPADRPEIVPVLIEKAIYIIEQARARKRSGKARGGNLILRIDAGTIRFDFQDGSNNSKL